MKKATHSIRIEPRWPIALAILGVLCVLGLMPARIRLMPIWFPYAMAFMVILPLAGVWLSRAQAGWLRAERITMLIFSVLAEIVTFATLIYLVTGILERPADFGGRQLLTSSISAWVTNVLAFSLVYWQIDRGGPEIQADDPVTRPDWLFPQTEVPGKAPRGWRPAYIDYLFLAFSTATAFSTTEAVPLTSRAKLLMMFQSTVSLSTLVVVASRAINILGS